MANSHCNAEIDREHMPIEIYCTDCTEEGQQPTEQERLNTGLVPTEGQGAPARWIRKTEESVQYMPIKI
jgi:hypothetical protein